MAELDHVAISNPNLVRLGSGDAAQGQMLAVSRFHQEEIHAGGVFAAEGDGEGN